LSQRKHAIPAEISSKDIFLFVEELVFDSTNLLIVSTWRTRGEVMIIGEAFFSPNVAGIQRQLQLNFTGGFSSRCQGGESGISLILYRTLNPSGAGKRSEGRDE
jgi:hypothetical protein